jgi:hypothetical protein
LTFTLENAISAAPQLPESEQDALASIIPAEIEDERLWAEKFSRTQDALGRWANKVRAEIK